MPYGLFHVPAWTFFQTAGSSHTTTKAKEGRRERERRKVGNSRSIQPQAFYKTPVFPKMALLVIRRWRYFVLEGLLDF